MQIPTTMAAAAPYPIPLMTTFTWSYGHHITPTKRESHALHSSTIVIFFLPLVLRRRPTYAIAQELTTSRPPWLPPMPHMTIFPWIYGRNIAPIERLSPLLYTTTIRLFFLRQVLCRWTAYASSCIYMKYQRQWLPPIPHMIIIPWSYSHGIAPGERLLPLLNTTTIRLFFRNTNRHRRHLVYFQIGLLL